MMPRPTPSRSTPRFVLEIQKNGTGFESKEEVRLLQYFYFKAFSTSVETGALAELQAALGLRFEQAKKSEEEKDEARSAKSKKSRVVHLQKVKIRGFNIEKVRVDLSEVGEPHAVNLIKRRFLAEVKSQMIQSIECQWVKTNDQSIEARCLTPVFLAVDQITRPQEMVFSFPTFQKFKKAGTEEACTPDKHSVCLSVSKKYLSVWDQKSEIKRASHAEGSRLPTEAGKSIRDTSVAEVQAKLDRLKTLESIGAEIKVQKSSAQTSVDSWEQQIRESQALLNQKQTELNDLKGASGQSKLALETQKQSDVNAMLVQKTERLAFLKERIPNFNKIAGTLEIKMKKIQEESIFGVTKEKEMLFLIDGSGSIRANLCKPYSNCLEYAVRQLTFTLDQLKPGQKFNVAFFANDVSAFALHSVAASAENIQLAKDFLTDLYDFEANREKQKTALVMKQNKVRTSFAAKHKSEYAELAKKLSDLHKVYDPKMKALKTKEALGNPANEETLIILTAQLKSKEEALEKDLSDKLGAVKTEFESKLAVATAEEEKKLPAKGGVRFPGGSGTPGTYGGYGIQGSGDSAENLDAAIAALQSNDLGRVYALTDAQYTSQEHGRMENRLRSAPYSLTLKPLAEPDFESMKAMTSRNGDQLLSQATNDSVKDFSAIKKEYEGLDEERKSLPIELSALKSELPSLQEKNLNLKQKVQILAAQQEFEIKTLQSQMKAPTAALVHAMEAKQKNLAELKEVVAKLSTAEKEMSSINAELKDLERP